MTDEYEKDYMNIVRLYDYHKIYIHLYNNIWSFSFINRLFYWDWKRIKNNYILPTLSASLHNAQLSQYARGIRNPAPCFLSP